MESLFARLALLPEGWRENVRIGLAADGTIADVETGSEAVADEGVGILMPGFRPKIQLPGLVLVFSQGAPEGAFDTYVQNTSRMFDEMPMASSPFISSATLTPKTGTW